MTPYTYPRNALLQYGCTPAHRYVTEWVGGGGGIVVGLGATAEEAEADAYASEARGEYSLEGGRLVTSEIVDA